MYEDTYQHYTRKLNVKKLEGTFLKTHCNKKMTHQAILSYLATLKSISRLTLIEGEVMRAFMSFGDSGGNNIRPSISSVAAILDVHPNTVKKAISTLTKKGWLKSDPVDRHDMQPVVRRFFIPDDVKERLNEALLAKKILNPI
jgi:DNA-binding MarR family transcriptional regulator